MNQVATNSNRVDDLINDGISFQEHFVNLTDMKCIPTDDYNKDRGAGSKKNLKALRVEFDGGEFKPSERFWLSFCAKVGIAPSIFNLYDHHEVFNRVLERDKFSLSGNVRVVEDCRNKELLAVTDPSKAIADWKSVLDLIDEKDGVDLTYNDGIISSTHALQADTPVKIGNEDHQQRIVVYTPIDGYGLPSIYLALMRLVCTNGMVAMSKAFKTSVKVGKKRGRGSSATDDTVEFALERMFDSYSNDEGFDALIQRMDAARTSPMSVREFYQVSKILAKLGHRAKSSQDGTKKIDIAPELRSWHNLSGDLHTKYGLAHLKEMTEKQMSLLETDLSVYEAINYISEVATHRLSPRASKDIKVARELHGWVGTKVSRSYDLEGTMPDYNIQDEFQDRYFATN